MKSTQITSQLKAALSVKTNDEIMPAIEAALAAKAAPPIGISIIVSNGQIVSQPIGVSSPLVLAEMDALQHAMRAVLEWMDARKSDLIRAEVVAEIEARAVED